MNTPQKTVPKSPPVIDPDADPDFAEEAAPKSSEFGTESDARAITEPKFEKIP